MVVMLHYSSVTHHCPHLCSCSFYHFAVRENSDSPSFTVAVNCSHQHITSLPGNNILLFCAGKCIIIFLVSALPPETVFLDLSHNMIKSEAFNKFDIVQNNYEGVASLILSYNSIHRLILILNLTLRASAADMCKMKFQIHLPSKYWYCSLTPLEQLTGLRAQRSLMLDHNNLTSISSHFSLLLQSFQENKIKLGFNPWSCECGAEITDRVDTALQPCYFII